MLAASSCVQEPNCELGTWPIPEDCPISRHEVCIGTAAAVVAFSDGSERSCIDYVCSDEWRVVEARCTALGGGSGGGGGGEECVDSSSCCRVCDQGQACGDTCIDLDLTCSAGDGCACNPSELCR